MSTQILYGVGSTVLRDINDSMKIIALSKLKNVSVDTSSSEDKLYGGDSPFPIASFPKEKSIKVSAENATFDMSIINATQGADITVGKVVMSEIIDLLIPEDGVIELKHEPIPGSAVIKGFTEASGANDVESGKFYLDATKKTLVFDVEDAGQEVTGVYEWESSTKAETLSVMRNTLAKPFKFTHRLPVYDDNNNIVAEAQITVFKAKASNNLQLSFARETAFAPKFEFEAQDPKRSDGKLWDFTIDPVE